MKVIKANAVIFSPPLPSLPPTTAFPQILKRTPNMVLSMVKKKLGIKVVITNTTQYHLHKIKFYK